ncbi:MAG: putative molybdenum carrier protein [Gemmatales bacterium]|nr:putative molybdenum carrier protein [Gemmatales bacterium]MDW7993949.1 putative molybdenum carrier protein [Gemmatales bacterium]
MLRLVIWSGGQTGVDRAALDFAIHTDRPYGGWCPRGGWAEDLTTPPGLLAIYPRLLETPSRAPEQRTAWNVRDSHATLIVVRGEALHRSPGTQLTKQLAELVFLRPYRIVNLTEPHAIEAGRSWLTQVAHLWPDDELVINIAGPRESEDPGIYADTLKFLTAIFS